MALIKKKKRPRQSSDCFFIGGEEVKDKVLVLIENTGKLKDYDFHFGEGHRERFQEYGREKGIEYPVDSDHEMALTLCKWGGVISLLNAKTHWMVYLL